MYHLLFFVHFQGTYWEIHGIERKNNIVLASNESLITGFESQNMFV